MLLSYQAADGSLKTIRLKTIAHAKAITIGRSKDADITIDDAQASRVNSAIRYWDDIFVIRDMKSHNGTMVNGERVEVAKLNAGDAIKIGDTEIFVAVEEGSATDVTITSD